MKVKKIKSALVLLTLCLFSGFPQAFAQNSKAELPDTILGNIVREWLAVIEGGKPEEIERFIETRFSAAAKKNQPTAARYFRKLHEQSGGLQILGVTPPTGEMPMYLLVKSKRGKHFARVTVGGSRDEPGKLAGIGLNDAPDPNRKKLSIGTTPASDAEMIAAIRTEFDRRAAAGQFSGAILIAKDDRILFQNAYGLADREAKIPNRLETEFHLASVGKMLTAAAIAQLVNAGKLSFDDEVGKLLPDFSNEEIKKITVHQLLTHTAGMGTFFESPGFERGRVYRTATEEIAVYKNEKLFFAPGARWRYSNAGYSLLAAIIEKISGKTYPEYLRENIFAPLGMKDRPGGEAARKSGSIANFYVPSDDDPLGLEALRPVAGITDSTPTGFGGGHLSADGLFRFARALASGELLGAETTRKMLEPKVSRNPSTSQGYGNVSQTVNGQTVVGHTGGGRASVQIIKSARKLIYPADSGFAPDTENADYVVIVLTNTMPPRADDAATEIIEFLTGQLSIPKAVELKKR